MQAGRCSFKVIEKMTYHLVGRKLSGTFFWVGVLGGGCVKLQAYGLDLYGASANA